MLLSVSGDDEGQSFVLGLYCSFTTLKASTKMHLYLVVHIQHRFTVENNQNGLLNGRESSEIALSPESISI